jgi:hypothetical protein
VTSRAVSQVRGPMELPDPGAAVICSMSESLAHSGLMPSESCSEAERLLGIVSSSSGGEGR